MVQNLLMSLWDVVRIWISFSVGCKASADLSRVVIGHNLFFKGTLATV